MEQGHSTDTCIPEQSGPSWLVFARDQPVLDVRAYLDMGQDPFLLICDAADRVEFGGFLVIDAPFNPSPLRRILGGRGFASFGQRLQDHHWRIYFHLNGSQQWDESAEAELSPEGALVWQEEDGMHLDVRRLVPPQPMVAILRTIDGSPGLGGLVVHHDRMPHYLLPELVERGWHISAIERNSAGLRLLLKGP